MRMLLLSNESFSIGVLDLAAYYEQHGYSVDIATLAQQRLYDDVYDVVGCSYFALPTLSITRITGELVTISHELHAQFPRAKLWLGGRALSLLSAADIAGLARASDYAVICSSAGETFVTSKIDFDAYPAWSVKHVQQLRSCIRRKTLPCVQTARGCLYACNFCHRAQPLRCFAPTRTARNIQLIASLYKFPMIVDDIFTLDASRMRALRVELDQLALAYKQRMRFFTHARHGNEAEIASFDPAEVQIGLESGDDRMLSLMGKGTSRADNMLAVRRLYEAIPGRLTGLFMVGYPGEDEDSLKNTLAFIRETRACYHRVWVSYFVPIPGTVGAQQARARGEIIEDASQCFEPAYIDDQLSVDVLCSYRERMLAAVHQ